MKVERETASAPIRFGGDTVLSSEFNNLDRRLIRVDIPPSHAGIAAALRRAFEAAASDPADHDFAELLRKLN